MKTIGPIDWAIILCSSIDRGLLAGVVGPKAHGTHNAPPFLAGEGNRPRLEKENMFDEPSVDPQFCPSTLAFILWVSHSPIVLI